jgi:hypothetical protein
MEEHLMQGRTRGNRLAQIPRRQALAAACNLHVGSLFDDMACLGARKAPADQRLTAHLMLGRYVPSRRSILMEAQQER